MDINRLINSEFTLDPDVVYLNHAAVSPWPVRTSQAVQKFAIENQHRGAQHYPRWMETESALRHQMAELINAPSADDIAILKNTSEALSFVAYGLDWNEGDNIIISDQEFPSNKIVWQSLTQYGVEVREIDLNSANNAEEALINAMDRNTRLLSISSVQYATGLRMNLHLLGEVCKDHKILFCVDAIQSIGAMDFNAQSVQADFVMADGHKWMLGPEGVALFYCRADLREQLKLHEFGWHMVEAMGDYANTDWQPASNARRFECGSPNMLGIHALRASLSLLLEAGMPIIEKRILANSRFLIEQITQHPDLILITDPTPARLSGIVTFQNRNQNSQSLYKHLMQIGVICAHRGGGVRFSPHFYTSEENLMRAIEHSTVTA